MNAERSPEHKAPIEEAFEMTLNEAEKLIFEIIRNRLERAEGQTTELWKNEAEYIVFQKFLDFAEHYKNK